MEVYIEEKIVKRMRRMDTRKRRKKYEVIRGKVDEEERKKETRWEEWNEENKVIKMREEGGKRVHRV